MPTTPEKQPGGKSQAANPPTFPNQSVACSPPGAETGAVDEHASPVFAPGAAPATQVRPYHPYETVYADAATPSNIDLIQLPRNSEEFASEYDYTIETAPENPGATYDPSATFNPDSTIPPNLYFAQPPEGVNPSPEYYNENGVALEGDSSAYYAPEPFDAGAEAHSGHYLPESSHALTGERVLPENADLYASHRQVALNRTPAPEKKRKSRRSKLLSLLAELADDEEEEEEETSEEEHAPKLLQAKRFSRTGATPEGNPLSSRPRPDRFPEPQGINGDHYRIFSYQPARDFRGLATLLACACLILLGLVIYLFMKSAEEDKKSPSSPAERSVLSDQLITPAAVTDRALGLADSILLALRNGDFDKANGLYKHARDSKVVLPGMNYQAALLALASSNPDTAFPLINHGIEVNEDAVKCLYLRAQVSTSQGDYINASSDFADAVRLTPFDARNYFFWAECLRRQGNTASALAQFKQALLRRPNPAEVELIYFKMNLAKIEADSDPDFQKELANHVSAPNVSGDTLLLAFANELNLSNFVEASNYLRRCVQILPRASLELRLGDYFFRNYLRTPEVSTILNAIRTPVASDPSGLVRKRVLIDPSTRSMAESDPALWH